ncbi:hypothetical protein [Luteolibacter luteus]|uniref:HEAT repeat domain-containing protein n=1 Tax=Luteolibacter luteus TaxID=2728835 RepID=A0A858RIB4_9BACT|nr:hypothetical protein [Luteolibacter luteus]QJE96284.1 hypothetical protein HHL09_10970 [Luteolibacter luteus]
MAETDPNRAREMLQGWTDALARVWGDTAGKVGIALARTNPGELEDFIGNEVPETMRTTVWSQALSQLPPTERFAYLELVPEGQDKMGMIADMIAAWLPQDPKATAAWLDQFAGGREADELTLLTQPRIYLDPAGNPIPASRAGDWLAALRSATTPEARAFLARQVLASSGNAPDAGILAELANADPNMAGLARDKMIQADAAGYAGNLSSQEIAALSSAEAEKVIGEWAKKQPRRALDWALEQDRPEAATALMALYYQEPAESIALVPTLKSGKERDAAIRSICALEAAGGKAESSRSLLALIGDPQQREAVRQNVERHLENAGKAGSH